MWRRPWTIFGISAFVIAVVTTCLFGNALVRVQRQHAILMEINARGGGYEYAPNDDWGIPFAWQVPRSVQLRVNANVVDLTAILALASELKDIQTLEVSNARSLSTVQLQSIGAMRSLQNLFLVDAGIGDSDVVQLVDLSKLLVLNLEGSRVTSASLKQFSQFPELVKLHLLRTPMDYSSVQAWAQAHPQCQVQWRPPFTHRQQEICAQLDRLGVRVEPLVSMSVEPEWTYVVGLRDHRRAWPLVQELRTVQTVILGGEQYVDWDVGQLAQLPLVKHIYLRGVSITPSGIALLATLPQLESLDVSGVDVAPNELLTLRNRWPQLQLNYGWRAGTQHPRPPYRGTRYEHEQPLPELLRPRPL